MVLLINTTVHRITASRTVCPWQITGVEPPDCIFGCFSQVNWIPKSDLTVTEGFYPYYQDRSAMKKCVLSDFFLLNDLFYNNGNARLPASQ